MLRKQYHCGDVCSGWMDLAYNTRLTYVEGMFIVFLGLSNILTASTVYKTSCHNYFFLLPVYLIILQLYKTENEVLLT